MNNDLCVFCEMGALEWAKLEDTEVSPGSCLIGGRLADVSHLSNTHSSFSCTAWWQSVGGRARCFWAS